MCGISGIYHPNHIEPGLKDIFIPVLGHRGPDASGAYMNGNIALFHNRLSILDLSASANQPFFSHDNRYCMVYNGEIYNYRSLAPEVKKHHPQQGFEFKTTSDTEVILEAFAIWGPDFVYKLNGMFSFAIYDTLENTLFIFRDRLGIKPLYYSFNGTRLIFSSELKTFAAYTGQELSLNENALKLYLHQGFIPAPYSIYNEVKKLVAGQYLRLSGNALHVHKFWGLEDAFTPEMISDEKTAITQFGALIRSSVQDHLVSDVPVGVFLSGGIDSSLITALAVDVSPMQVNTFSIGFEESKFNEAEYAKNIAAHLGTNHHEYILSYRHALDLIDQLTDVYDEPFADSSAIPTMLVSKLAREKVKVTLSGDGGDELFMGYGAYTWAQRLNNPVLRSTRRYIRAALSRSGDMRKKRAAAYFDFDGNTFLPSHILSQEQNLFSAQEVKMLTGSAPQLEMMRNKMALDTLPRGLNPMEQQALFDLHYYLPGDLLTKVDRASMRYSLETRVPFLDHRIVEMALNLSPELKLKGKTSKYILREILYNYVPKTYFERPKQGFSIPLEKWLAHELKDFILDHLQPGTLIKAGLVKNTEQVTTLCNRFYAGETFLYNRLWTLALLHRWKFKARV